MTKDLQDTPAAPSGICILIEDHFDVLKGLVNCSEDIESGCLEPFKTTKHYKAHLLHVNTVYYSTQIQVLSFDKLSNYKEWHNSIKESSTPSALFICVDMNKSEKELKSFLEQLDGLEIDQTDTRSLLLFGEIPCSINNVEHPKAQLIQKFVELNYIEIVRFQPNEEELEELEENHEIHGIIRVWELLGIVDWSTKILKKGIDNFASLSISTGLPSSLSNKCKAAKRPLVMENFCRQSQEVSKNNQIYAGMEPTAKDEECIYNFLLHASCKIPAPDFKQQKAPTLTMKYLIEQRDRVQRGVRLSKEDNTYKCPNLASSEIKPIRLLSTEATLPLRESPQNLNTRMSIVNTNKQLKPDKETRAGSTSINVRSTTNQPVTTDLISSSVQQDKKKSKGKKTINNSNNQSNSNVGEEKAMKEMEAEIARKYDEINNRGVPVSTTSLKDWVQNWLNVKDTHPPNDNNVIYVATQLTKTFIGQNSAEKSDLSEHLDQKKKNLEKSANQESKKDK